MANQWVLGVVTVLLSAQLVSGFATDSGPIDNDAGTGMDAPNSLEEAVSSSYLANATVHNGVAGPSEPGSHGLPSGPDPGDFYRLRATAGTVMHVNFGGAYACLTLLFVDKTQLNRVCPLYGNGLMQLWAHIPSNEDVYLAVEAHFGGPYSFSYDLDVAAPHPEFAGQPVSPHNDGGLGHDAPDIIGPQSPIQGGASVSGQSLLATGDVRDIFLIDAPAGSVARVHVLVGTPACFAVIQTTRELINCPIVLGTLPASVTEKLLEGPEPYYVGVSSLGTPYEFQLEIIPPSAP